MTRPPAFVVSVARARSHVPGKVAAVAIDCRGRAHIIARDGQRLELGTSSGAATTWRRIEVNAGELEEDEEVASTGSEASGR